MRKKIQTQMPLIMTTVEHKHAKALAAISDILDRHPTIYELAWQDLAGKVKNPGTGAQGMTAEQVVRAAIIKQLEQYSYEELAFHLVDSRCYRSFCRIGFSEPGFKKSALASNIKALSPQTWEAINRILVHDAQDRKVEKGRETRIDCTVVASDIHEPSDSTLLWDAVRVLSRLLNGARAAFPELELRFVDHRRTAKRRMLEIPKARKAKRRQKRYEQLLKITERTVGYAQAAVPLLADFRCTDLWLEARAQGLSQQLEHFIELTHRVMEQTRRRVIEGQQVPASEKLVSLFETHTDVIVKDNRDTLYGHKICLTSGKSGLLLDCVILYGNPADSDLTQLMLDRQKDLYGQYPLKAALDGGFASKENLKRAKAAGVKDVCFAKKRGLEVTEMCRSEWVYNRLRRFRAGIESAISWLKRSFGLARCTWKSLRSFKSYVWASIVAANLMTMARKQLA